jgi:large subunit ribosomal protein L35
MPKVKSHKGLLKRIKISKTGKVRFKKPRSRHLKSNKTGAQVRSYRKNKFARSGDIRALAAMLHRPLRSQEQHLAAKEAEAQAASKPESAE